MSKKQGVKKSLAIYNGIFSKSLATVWSHKKLWLIAAIAGIANTGAVFNRVLNSFWQVQPADKITLETFGSIFKTFPWIEAYIRQTLMLGNVRIIVTVAVIIIFLAVCAILIVTSQQLLLIHSHKQIRSKKHLTLDALGNQIKSLHFWRIFSVDALVYLSTTIIVLASAIPLAVLLQATATLNTFIYFGFYLVLLPLGFIINALGMFTLVNIVRHDEGLLKAFHQAWQTLKKHWLVAFEVAIILYFFNIISSVLFYIALILIAVPILFLSTASIGTSSFGLVTLVGAFGGSLIVIVAALIAGAITMFNYSTWTHLTDRLERYAFLPAIESVMRKFKK